ncbi:acyl-CoA dehydrogenase [Mycobacterium sp. CVI_P3]|uniref:Acyl-CoA dehydrogenase n=1 Tax=Mycobacterium pinniadriaticum TaxID=2994102 RepID=A0ABT3S7L8_9MYCO|nr:acyl-CoA dehydrogenase [Mycobacterium pinniadriaticum]MCX2928979.1 acyl-CoA dehydrogenase [Mycobacterium pinniadriaticum]MCX2935154.1 acyl-CoA dehydrogenase [Mycobacterium pinniadriaticum]
MSATITDEQFAARELVRSWAASSGALAAVRDVEHGTPEAWRPVYRALADLGLFGVAVAEDAGGAGGSIQDLCAMVEEAARALIPGPVATTAVATLVITDAELLEALAAGESTAGLALAADLRQDGGRVSGTADHVLGADTSGVLLLPVGDEVVVVDAAADGVTVESLAATDFSRPLARVTLNSVPATKAAASRRRFEDLTATVLAAETAGLARWTLDTAVEYAKVREQFGKPIGSFQAIKHMCAEMLLRSQQAAVAAADAAGAASSDVAGPAAPAEQQLAIAAAIAAAIGIESAKANAKDCIQVLGGIGITWEHDAHLYLRRAYSIGQILGGRPAWLRRVCALTLDGVRRELHIDLDSVAHLQPEIAAAVAEVAALPADDRQPALAATGLLAPHWPKPYGREASPAEQLLIDSELAKSGVQRPDLVIGWWAVPTILEGGTPEQIDRFVPATLRGEIIWCQLFSEPGAGSDLAALRTKAVRAEGGWKLTGQKVWTSAAQKAHWGVCLARTDADAPKHKGITYFLVDMRSPGIVVRPLREITGDELFNEVFFDDVFVPDDMVVGTVNDGWRLARTTLANERVAMAQGTALGNPVEEMLRTVAERELDTALQDQTAKLILSAQAGSLLDQRIAQLAVGGHDTSAEASARKLIGVRHRQALAEFRLELSDSGGLVIDGFVHDFLNTRCLTIAGGTEQILLTLAGERLLGLPR